MKSIEEVQEFFETDIKPKLGYIEDWRIKTFKKFRKAKLGCLVPMIIVSILFLGNLLLYAFRKDSEWVPFVAGLTSFLIIMILPVAGYIVIRRNIRDKSSYNHYNVLFKQAVIDKLVKFMDNEITYCPWKNFVSGDELLGGEIFEHLIYYPIGYQGEDFFEGKIGDTKIKFYEIDGNDVEEILSSHRVAKHTRIPRCDRIPAIRTEIKSSILVAETQDDLSLPVCLAGKWNFRAKKRRR